MIQEFNIKKKKKKRKAFLIFPLARVLIRLLLSQLFLSETT